MRFFWCLFEPVPKKKGGLINRLLLLVGGFLGRLLLSADGQSYPVQTLNPKP